MVPEQIMVSATVRQEVHLNGRVVWPRGPRKPRKAKAGFLAGSVRGAVLMAALQGIICGQAEAGQRADIDELKAALDAGATMLLIDVREDWEVASGSMPGSIHIPVAELERRMPDIPKDVRLVFF